MKQTFYYFFVLLCCSCFLLRLNAQNVNIPDPNFKAKLIALGVDTNNDGQIQTTEALAVNTLNLYNANINSLIGISDFTNLTVLSCLSNFIANLNLTGNPNLQNLNCSGNLLVNLDLSNNTKIKTLYCSYNMLNTLTLGNNDSLFQLFASNNSISTLDLTQNQKIGHFECSSCGLNTLYSKNSYTSYYWELFNNPNLTYICCDSSELFGLQSSLSSIGSPNCIIDTSCFTTIKYPSLNEIKFYPNPVESVLNFESKTDLLVSLFDINGQILPIELINNKMHLAELSKGIYLLKITSESGSLMYKVLKN